MLASALTALITVPVALLTAAPPPRPDANSLPVIGKEDSRYPAEAPLWKLAAASTTDALQTRAHGFRFAWGDVQWHGEGAIAMAAGVALQEFVGISEIHRSFCPGQAVCQTSDYERDAPGARVRVERVSVSAPASTRTDALAGCEAVLPQFRQKLQAALQRGRGAVVALWSPKSFPLASRGLENDSVHLFAVLGIDADGSILLRDAADSVPFTYAVAVANQCAAFAAPRAFSPRDSQRSYAFWGLSTWIVQRAAGREPPSPEPGPTPSMPPVPWPSPGAGDEGLGVAGDDPFNLGRFLVPAATPLRYQHQFASGGIAPARLRLGTGVSSETNAWSRGGLLAIEREWGVTRSGGRFAFVSRGDGRDPMSEAYRTLGARERGTLESLARRFEAGARTLGKDRRWLAASVVAWVQSIPYELIREDDMGLRAPSSVVFLNAGDCDSKSLLASSLLEILGFDTVIATSDAQRHAILGIALAGVSGAFIEHRGHRFVLVECTNPFAIGDGAPFKVQGDAARTGWKAWEVDA